jgi:hypothetical protein
MMLNNDNEKRTAARTKREFKKLLSKIGRDREGLNFLIIDCYLFVPLSKKYVSV